MSEFDSWERATDYMHNLVPAPVLRAIGFLWFYIDKTPNFQLPPEILMTKLWHSDKINHTQTTFILPVRWKITCRLCYSYRNLISNCLSSSLYISSAVPYQNWRIFPFPPPDQPDGKKRVIKVKTPPLIFCGVDMAPIFASTSWLTSSTLWWC